MTGADRIPSSLAMLRRWISEGGCLGGQVFVWQDGQVIADVAVGQSAPMRTAAPDDVGRLYCAVKPITGCCLARAVEAGLADFDDPVRRFLPEFSSGRREAITLRQLLSHTSRLPDTMYDPYAYHFRELAARAATVEFPPFAWYGEDRYNETLAWSVLAVVVERIFGADFTEVVRRVVAEPVGLPSLRIIDPDPARYVPCRVVGDGTFEPVAEPAGPAWFGHVDPAHGGFGSARDLGLFYAELLRCTTGDGNLAGAAVIGELIRPHATIRLWPGHGHRTVGLGFITDVAADEFGGGWSSRSFGHGGLAVRQRVVYAFADLDHQIAAAIRLFSAGAKNNWRYRRLGATLWSDLGPAETGSPDRAAASAGGTA